MEPTQEVFSQVIEQDPDDESVGLGESCEKESIECLGDNTGKKRPMDAADLIASEGEDQEEEDWCEVVSPVTPRAKGMPYDLSWFFDQHGTAPREQILMCRAYASYLASVLRTTSAKSATTGRATGAKKNKK